MFNSTINACSQSKFDQSIEEKSRVLKQSSELSSILIPEKNPFWPGKENLSELKF
jgi:hypothetical protein